MTNRGPSGPVGEADEEREAVSRTERVNRPTKSEG
jgi:hypothetical protein